MTEDAVNDIAYHRAIDIIDSIPTHKLGPMQYAQFVCHLSGLLRHHLLVGHQVAVVRTTPRTLYVQYFNNELSPWL